MPRQNGRPGRGDQKDTRNASPQQRNTSPQQRTGGYPSGDARSRRLRNLKEAKSAVLMHEMHQSTHDIDLSAMLLEQFRKILIQRGGSSGIHGLGRIFKSMDDDGNRKVTSDELMSGLKDYGLTLDSKSVKMLMDAIDKDNRGFITFDKFFTTLRGPVNSRRRAIIDMAFDHIDKTGDGKITVQDLANSFDVKHHPDVRSGRLQPQLAMDNFIAQFGGSNGKISRAEFQTYNKNLSASIDDDDYFELMIRNSWHIPGGKGVTENTSNTRVLVTFANGTQRVVCIDDDLGLDLKSFTAVTERLRKQGIKNVVKFALSYG